MTPNHPAAPLPEGLHHAQENDEEGSLINIAPCHVSWFNIDPSSEFFDPLSCEPGSGKSDAKLGSWCSDFHQWNDPLILDIQPGNNPIQMGSGYSENNCQPPTGACCIDEDCTDSMIEDDCNTFGGYWFRDKVCDGQVDCHLGSCCYEDHIIGVPLTCIDTTMNIVMPNGSPIDKEFCEGAWEQDLDGNYGDPDIGLGGNWQIGIACDDEQSGCVVTMPLGSCCTIIVAPQDEIEVECELDVLQADCQGANKIWTETGEAPGECSPLYCNAENWINYQGDPIFAPLEPHCPCCAKDCYEEMPDGCTGLCPCLCDDDVGAGCTVLDCPSGGIMSEWLCEQIGAEACIQDCYDCCTEACWSCRVYEAMGILHLLTRCNICSPLTCPGVCCTTGPQ